MAGWREKQPRVLKKVVYGLTQPNLEKVIRSHENRGWELASEIKEYRYGFGVLMIIPQGRNKDASNS